MKEWQHDAIALYLDGDLNTTAIAYLVEKPRTTCRDFLKRYKKAMEVPEESEYLGVTHMYLPDLQVKPGIDMNYLKWIGEYIVRKRPSVIINAGDMADMPSLSQWDAGTGRAEGKRLQEDIDCVIEANNILLSPLRKLQAKQKAKGQNVYNPRMVLTLGNHEDRISRYVNSNPNLQGFVSVDSLKYKEAGWEVVDFLKPIIIDGISYCHYFTNNMTGKPLGGNALNMLKTIGTSFTQGHKQTLDVATRFLPSDGKQQWGIIAGACYLHEEHYKGHQGNHHWRGVIVKHNVKDGSYDPLFVSLDWLKKEYDK